MKTDGEGSDASAPEPGDEEQKNRVEVPLLLVAVLPGVRGSRQQAGDHSGAEPASESADETWIESQTF